MWYAIQVEKGKEMDICEYCKKMFSTMLFCDVFVPICIQEKKYQGVWKEEQKVLLPGYVFVETDDSDFLENKLANLNCVDDSAYSIGEILTIREEEQDILLDMMDAGYIIQPSIGYIVDGQLKVTKGALKNYTDYVKRIDRHKRMATMNLTFLNEEKSVFVGLEVVAKVTKEEFEGMQVKIV